VKSNQTIKFFFIKMQIEEQIQFVEQKTKDQRKRENIAHKTFILVHSSRSCI